MTDCKAIAESNNFIVLDQYTKIEQQGAGYQAEADLVVLVYKYGHEKLNTL